MEAEQQHKKTLRDLIGGKEVTFDAARDALRWLRADGHVTPTNNGGVRLRVPIMPKATADVRGARA